MISAKEAKNLFDESGAEVDQFLRDNVEKKVVDAARSGKRVTFIYLGSLAPYRYLSQEITPVQQAVAEKLKELGYCVEIKLDGARYVPLGVRDDDGHGPMHQNYGIQIGW